MSQSLRIELRILHGICTYPRWWIHLVVEYYCTCLFTAACQLVCPSTFSVLRPSRFYSFFSAFFKSSTPPFSYSFHSDGVHYCICNGVWYTLCVLTSPFVVIFRLFSWPINLYAPFIFHSKLVLFISCTYFVISVT